MRRLYEDDWKSIAMILLMTALVVFASLRAGAQPSSIEDKLNFLFMRVQELQERVDRLEGCTVCSTGRNETVLIEE